MLVSRPRLAVPKSVFAFAKGLYQVTLQSFQVVDLTAHRAETALDEIAHMSAGFRALVLNKQQFTNLRERKPEFLGLVDEMQVLDIPRRIEPETAFAALWLA